MNDFDQELRRRLEHLRAEGLYRELRRVDSPQGVRVCLHRDGRELLNFSSNDYLGLAAHPALREAAEQAAADWGAGSGASRLICGSLGIHHEAEAAIAGFKGTAAALSFSSGYAAAIGTLGALAGRDDILIIDKLVHACVVDASRLSGAKLRVFAHNDVGDLEAILQWAAREREAAAGNARRHVWVVTESVFSMDGDRAPLREIITLKDRYGAWLMLDEAHATGLHGSGRRGLAEELGVADRIEVQMGTLGKALGAAGGYICGSAALVDYLVNRARSFIFSTAPVPAASGAVIAALALVQSDEGRQRCAGLWSNVRRLKEHLREAGLPVPAGESAIVPVVLGAEERAVEVSSILRERGLWIPAIRYPTVARGTARLRLTVTAAHTADDLGRLGEELQRLRREGRLI